MTINCYLESGRRRFPNIFQKIGCDRTADYWKYMRFLDFRFLILDESNSEKKVWKIFSQCIRDGYYYLAGQENRLLTRTRKKCLHSHFRCIEHLRNMSINFFFLFPMEYLKVTMKMNIAKHILGRIFLQSSGVLAMVVYMAGAARAERRKT